jgi:hypothetical protein
MYTSKECRIE